jgi:hypothetical protein
MEKHQRKTGHGNQKASKKEFRGHLAVAKKKKS